MNDDLIRLVTTARFTPVFRLGYAMAPVDEFLDRIVEHLSAGRPVAPMIEGRHFPLASWTEAYERDEVDLLLAQVKHHAEVREPTTDLETPPTVAEAPRVPAPRSEGTVEKKSVLTRLFGAR